MPGAALVLLAVDAALLVLVAEAVLLVALRRRHGLSVRTILLIALSGLCLIAALRAALIGAPGPVILLCLSLGGIAHAIDLAARLRGAR